MDRTIAPGATDSIRVEYNAGAQPGIQTRTVTVRSNDPTTPTANLNSRIKTAAALVFEPSSLDFGRVERTSGPVSRTIRVRKGDAGAVEPKLEPFANQYLSATLREVTPGELYEIDVTLAPPWPNSAVGLPLSLSTGVAELPRETVYVLAQIPPRVTTEPRFIAARTDQPEAQVYDAQVIWNGEAPGKILGVRTNDERVTATYVEDGGLPRIQITLPPAFSFDARRVIQVVVETDDPLVPEFNIPVSAARALPVPGRSGPSIRSSKN